MIAADEAAREEEAEGPWIQSLVNMTDRDNLSRLGASLSIANYDWFRVPRSKDLVVLRIYRRQDTEVEKNDDDGLLAAL